jgi:hypothetical protein
MSRDLNLRRDLFRNFRLFGDSSSPARRLARPAGSDSIGIYHFILQEEASVRTVEAQRFQYVRIRRQCLRTARTEDADVQVGRILAAGNSRRARTRMVPPCTEDGPHDPLPRHRARAYRQSPGAVCQEIL